MAAFDTPWVMSNSASSSWEENSGSVGSNDPNPPTVAAFSPVTLSNTTSISQQRSTILVHQKSPLLLATPPQITRALAYSHPFLLPLNRLAGLLTWTSGDPWESFLLLATFWAVVMYGDVLILYAGPLVVVMVLILGMYSRRYSPLSSTGWTGEKQPKKQHRKSDSEITHTKHQKTLDEIVEALKEFTSRCNVLLDPLLELTDFLSTQRTATSATTKPALTTLLIRILLITPIWIALTLKPIQIITTKRIVLVTGTLCLTWHSRPTRVARAILWRSILIRRVCNAITGLQFSLSVQDSSTEFQGTNTNFLSPRERTSSSEKFAASFLTPSISKRLQSSSGVRFTFILYENQRRWIGLGWTTSLFAYERAAWTDEHLNPAPSKENFELPDAEGGTIEWRWVKGSRWLVEGAEETEEGGIRATSEGGDGGMGWIYYDSKWQQGRRGVDGWSSYTRRRKWYRDAELVEISPSKKTVIVPSPAPSENFPPPTVTKTLVTSMPSAISAPSLSAPKISTTDTMSIASQGCGSGDSASIRSYNSAFLGSETRDGSEELGRKSTSKSGSAPSKSSMGMVRRTVSYSQRSSFSGHSNTRKASDDDVTPKMLKDGDWGIGDDAKMALE